MWLPVCPHSISAVLRLAVRLRMALEGLIRAVGASAPRACNTGMSACRCLRHIALHCVNTTALFTRQPSTLAHLSCAAIPLCGVYKRARIAECVQAAGQPGFRHHSRHPCMPAQHRRTVRPRCAVRALELGCSVHAFSHPDCMLICPQQSQDSSNALAPRWQCRAAAPITTSARSKLVTCHEKWKQALHARPGGAAALWCPSPPCHCTIVHYRAQKQEACCAPW